MSGNKDLVQSEFLTLEKTVADSGIKLTASQRDALEKYSQALSNGSALAIVMNCKGQDCPVYKNCPLVLSNINPQVGSKCPVEIYQINKLIATHCAALDIDPTTPMGALEMLQVLEIARAEVLEYRASAMLAENPNLVRTSLISVELDGTKIFEDRIVPEVEILERWFKIKTKLRTELLATRQSQAAAGKSYSDKSKEASELNAKLEELKKLKNYRENMQMRNKDEIIIDTNSI